MAGGTGSLILIALLAAAAVAAIIAWRTARRQAQEAARLGEAHSRLARSLFETAAPAEIVKLLAGSLPGRAAAVRLYRVQQEVNSLVSVPTAADPDPVALPLDSPRAAPLAACLERRRAVDQPPLVLAPVVSRDDVIGVLEVDAGAFQLSAGDRQLIESTALYCGAALRLSELDSLRENVNVSERQAAAGQLISTGASELVQPLDAVIALARDVAAESDSHAVQLAAILREARRAREIADRLITFSDPGQADFQTLDLHELLAKLLAFREKDRQEASIRLENHLSPQPAWILGSRSQLEQAFLAVLVHAEQQAVRAADRALRVRSSLMGGRAVVEVAFTANGPVRSSDLGACAMVVDAHGGELRILEEDFCRVQVDLPLDNVASDRQQERVQLPRLTALVVEPDPGKQRQLVNALAQLGQRAVPVPGAEEALDLTQRHRFDLLLCTSRLLGSPAATRLRERARSFAFVTEPFETGVPADGIPRLRQPLREAELRQWIASVR